MVDEGFGESTELKVESLRDLRTKRPTILLW